MSRSEALDALLTIVGNLACEAWPSADLYLHGDKVPAAAIPRASLRRLIAIHDELKAGENE